MTGLCKLFLIGTLLLTPLCVGGEDITIPPPQGLVSDFAGVIDPPTRQQLTRLLQELKDKTGAEIPVVTVVLRQLRTFFYYPLTPAGFCNPVATGDHNSVA